MTFTYIVGIIAGLLSAWAWILYNVRIVQKITRPNRATWSILTLVGIMIFATYYDGGARDTIWVPLMYVLGPLVTVLLAIFYYGEGGWTSFDKKCLAIAGASAILWLALRSFVPHVSLATLLINIGIDCIGILPTIKKSWYEPQHENPAAWTIEFLACVANVLAISGWALSVDSFSIWVYPIYLVGINGIVAFILVRNTIVHKRRALSAENK